MQQNNYYAAAVVNVEHSFHSYHSLDIEIWTINKKKNLNFLLPFSQAYSIHIVVVARKWIEITVLLLITVLSGIVGFAMVVIIHRVSGES